jgi:PTH2 family peptidyl-tRNA hydrolase
MNKGKIAAQAGHAYLDAYLEAQDKRPETIPLYKQNHGIKICLAAYSLEDLLEIEKQAKDNGIPCALITDLGYTQFNGQPTVTAIGLGPCTSEEAGTLVNNLKLYN